MDNRSIDFTDNLPELTVSELSNQVKFTVESNFQRVRVKGEISRPTRASSGHLYLTLKMKMRSWTVYVGEELHRGFRLSPRMV